MGFLIGGFSKKQYDVYLNPNPTKREGISARWVDYFQLSRYPVIAILINRLAYFILHHFSIYPNNAYLFQRFKSYNFTTISTQEQYDAVKHIFNCFQRCLEVNQEELTRIGRELGGVERNLRAIEEVVEEDEISNEEESPEEEVSDEEKSNPESAKIVDEQKKEEVPEVEKESSKDTKKELQSALKIPDPSVKKDAAEIEEELLVFGKKTNQQEKVELKEFEKEEELEASGKTEEPKIQQEVEVEEEDKESSTQSSEISEEEDVDAEEKPPLIQPPLFESVEVDPTPSPISDDSKNEEDDFDPSDDQSESYASNEENMSQSSFGEKQGNQKQKECPSNLSDSTFEQVRELFNPSSSSETETLKESKQEILEARDETPLVAEKKIMPISGGVKVVLGKSFPLQDQESINDLYSEGQISKKGRGYYTDLETLLSFEKKLRLEKSTTEDCFGERLQKADQAFETAWQQAYEECKTWHQELKSTFPENDPALEDHEVVCTAAQLDWAIEKLKSSFPAIYQLAFDAPLFDIHQSLRVGSLVQSILLGPDDARSEVSSPFFIRLRETQNKTAPSFQHNDPQTNPFFKSGSYIYTHFVGPAGKVEEGEKLGQKFSEFAEAYVKDWLEREGAFLEFGGKRIQGGQETETIKASDWVKHVRDLYTQTLLNMSKEELEKEYNNLFNCPLVQSIVQYYQDKIDEQEWMTSRFPSALMEKIFEKKLAHVRDNNRLVQGIDKTIQDAHFKQEDIKALVEKANCTVEMIEPLLRIRVLYMMGCLGQTAIQPVVDGISQRGKLLYDETVCSEANKAVIHCDSSKERVLSFDPKFDQLKIAVKTIFKDSKQDPSKNNRQIAEGKSTLEVGSISHLDDSIQANVVDLQDLRFGVYISQKQRAYLMEQLDQTLPETLAVNMCNLVSHVEKLNFIQKANGYQTAKDNHWMLLNYFRAFNPASFRDLHQDRAHLDQAIYVAKALDTYCNIYQHFDKSQLSEDQSIQIQDSVRKICELMEKGVQAFGEIYTGEDNSDIQDKVRQITEYLSNCKPQEPDSLLHAPQEIRSPSPVSVESTGEDEEIIGKNVGKESKGFVRALWENTAGYFTKETAEVQYLTWKIERYEDLISGNQKNVKDYLLSVGYKDVDQFIELAKKENAPKWMSQLLPILELCKKGVMKGPERLKPEYLDTVRNTYTKELLTPLRQAAIWAKEHADQEGVEHIDAICYRLYASLDFNDRCHNVVDTFVNLGKSDPHPSHSLPNDKQYGLIQELHQVHQKIKSAPNDAKAPLVAQWGNSLRGHLNGLLGVTNFDPNMQSNPMHVFFNKVIQKKDESSHTTVKDIAMGSPTIEAGNGKAEINPEFLGFLRHCKRHGLVHLYINNQDYIPRAWIYGDESVRCKALHDLADNDEFKDVLYVVTLNQNSSFYQQKGYQFTSLTAQIVRNEIVTQLLGKSTVMKGYLPPDLLVDKELQKWIQEKMGEIHQNKFENCSEFKDENTRENFVQEFHSELRKHVEDLLKVSPASNGVGLGYSVYDGAEQFKAELIAQMFDRTPETTGNSISKDSVDKWNLRDWSLNAIDEIHQQIFGRRSELTVEEQRIFIRLFYQNLSRKMLIETKASSYNASCKDRIDRGAATDAEDFAYLAILANRMNEPQVIKFFNMLVFSRAIIVRKRTIIQERLERLIETVKFMLGKQRELQELQAKLFPDLKITIDQFDVQKSTSGKEEVPFPIQVMGIDS